MPVGRSDAKVLELLQVHPVEEGGAVRISAIEKSALLGRGKDCSIQLRDRCVSREHARIECRDGLILISDRGSRAGTFADGRAVSRLATAIQPGSVVRLGNTLLLVVENPEALAARTGQIGSLAIEVPHAVAAGPSTWQVWNAAMSASPLPHPVLITGESGTGKEIAARIIGNARASVSKMVSISLAAIPDGLIEAELFGYVRGAFTGAVQSRLGAFRDAGNGTLFLDEVGELKPEHQVKLLRVLESKLVRPLGSGAEIAVGARIVAATNRDLAGMVKAGTFRSDLYYRLSGIHIHLKPLRERREEILVLARVMLAREAPGLTISAAAAEQLLLRAWPGNIRELNYSMLKAALRVKARGDALVQVEDLPTDPLADESTRSAPRLTVDELRRTLTRTSGSATKAAQLLGVSRATLYNMCRRSQIELSTFRDEQAKIDIYQ